jgi:hypothetical protein
MNRRLSAAGSLGLVATTINGCYWLATYQDLTSDLSEAGSIDAQPFDAYGDTGVVVADSAAPADAGADAPGPVEAGPFCPPDTGPLSYCMDFDEIDAAALGLFSNSASTKIVSGISVSPPSSMEVHLGGDPCGGGYNVQFPFQPTTATLQYDIRVDSNDGWVTTCSIVLLPDTPQTVELLNVLVSPDDQFTIQEYFGLSDGGSASNVHPAAGPDGGASAGAWHHVVVSLTVDPSSQTYQSSLTVDGQVIEQDQPLGLSWSPGNANIGVGVGYAQAAGPQFYFDNIQADFGL